MAAPPDTGWRGRRARRRKEQGDPGEQRPLEAIERDQTDVPEQKAPHRADVHPGVADCKAQPTDGGFFAFCNDRAGRKPPYMR